MDRFPANSQRPGAKNEPKNIARVTSAEARPRRNRGLGRRMKEAFIVGDGRMAFEYMLVDVVIPAIQDTMIEAFQGGVEKWVRGEGSRRRRGGAPRSYTDDMPRVDYGSFQRGPGGSRASQPQRRMVSRSSKARGQFDDLIIPSRGDAEDVLEQMYEILSQYGAVSVADLYALTDVQSSHTDMKWGWLGLPGARLIRTRQGGYLLDLPDPEPLD